MGTAYLTVFGLNTPSGSECYGLRGVMESLAQAEDRVRFFEYDQKDLVSAVTAAAVGFERVVLCGHSFGGAAVKWVLEQWKGEGNPRVDVAVFLDPAPEGIRFGQFFRWQDGDRDLMKRWRVPLKVVERVVCVYQRNSVVMGGLVGVCGVPFVPVPPVADVVCVAGELAPRLAGRVQNFDVTGWGVHHCHMLGDWRVQELIRRAVTTT
jgi:pimeloyl-ACP methyl ester carboxylesterase